MAVEGPNRTDRPPVKCFTCPRERRGEEPGWYFVDVPERARAYGPARIFVCPRHYRHFAERERGRWTEIAPVLVPGTPAAWLEVTPTLAADGAPAAAAIAAVGVLDPLVSE